MPHHPAKNSNGFAVLEAAIGAACLDTAGRPA
jgi:hypothetical protein